MHAAQSVCGCTAAGPQFMPAVLILELQSKACVVEIGRYQNNSRRLLGKQSEGGEVETRGSKEW